MTSGWDGDLRNIRVAPWGTLRLSCQLELPKWQLGSSDLTGSLRWSWWDGNEGRKLCSTPQGPVLVGLVGEKALAKQLSGKQKT